MPSDPRPQTDKESTKEQPLESWKEIANYLQRNVRTAKRWEDSEGLPVHRHRHQARSSVYAYPSELDAWRNSRSPAAERPPAPPWRKPLPSVAFALVLLLSLISVGNGPRFGPEEAHAEEGFGIVVRQLWSEPEADFQRRAFSPRGISLLQSIGKPGTLPSTISKRAKTAFWPTMENGTSRSTLPTNPWFRRAAIALPIPSAVPRGTTTSAVVEVGPGPRSLGSRRHRIRQRSDALPGSHQLDPGREGDSHRVCDETEKTSQLAFVSVENGDVRVLKSFAWSVGRKEGSHPTESTSPTIFHPAKTTTSATFSSSPRMAAARRCWSTLMART